MRYLFLISLCFVSFSLLATSEQYVVRTEVSFCKYKEGKSYDDVIKYSKKYEKFLRANSLKYSRSIFVPVIAGNTEHDYVLWGTWPNGEEMYKEYGAYLNDYKNIGSENPGICHTNVAFFNTGALHLRIPFEEYDRVQMVEFRACKFTDNSSWSEILQLAADNEERVAIQTLLKENGIPSMFYYPIPLHQQAVFNTQLILPVAEDISSRIFSVPMHPYLSEEDVKHICGVVNAG